MEPSVKSAADIDLSDEQVFELLKTAEQRLKTTTASALDVQTLGNQSLSSESALQTRHMIGSEHSLLQSYIKSSEKGAWIDRSFVASRNHGLANGPRVVQSTMSTKVSNSPTTAGADWYDLPRTTLTPELKRDLQLLRLRSVLDPHRHYKKDNSRKNQIPEYSQVGTIIEGPTEFFSSRLTNKERKRTFVEEVLAAEKATHRFKSKYNEIQAAKTSGKKVHYKAIKAQRLRKSSKV